MGRVADLFASVFLLVDLSGRAMVPLGQLILLLTCLGPDLDLAGGPSFPPRRDTFAALSASRWEAFEFAFPPIAPTGG
jgi:hypothetical protein